MPTDLQGRLVNSKGKPLTRLERSTQTDSLALAKKRYPEVMSALKAELADQAAVSTETPEEKARRLVAQSYVRGTDEKYLATLQAKREKIAAKYPGAEKVLDGFSVDGLFDVMLSMTSEQRLKVFRSIEHVKVEADKTNEANQGGFFVEPSQYDQKFRDAANAPLPVTFDDVLKLKKAEVSSRTYTNITGTVEHWISIVGSNKIASVATSSLNNFARTLKKPTIEGGRGYTTQSANDAAARIKSLIKTYNVNAKEDSQRIAIPEWDPIRLTVEEKKQQKIADNAISEKDARKVLQYAADDNQGIWIGVLILCNTTFRINELMDLRWGCIKQLDGVVYFDLTDSKTVTGIRRHPLNSHLIKHLLPLRKDDDDLIVGLSQWSRPSDEFSRWLKRAKEVLSIQGKTNAHSFRHAAGGQLGYNCSEHIKKKLMGHAGGMTDHYTREDMTVLSQAVEHLGFDF